MRVNEMERTIVVTGKAALSFRPDTVQLSLYLQNESADYSAAAALAAQAQEQLSAAVAAAGFDTAALRTENYGVHTRYEQRRQEDGTIENILRAYVCEQTLGLSFLFKEDKLQALLEALSQCPAAPRLDIGFSVGDMESVTEKLLEAACRDAQQRAGVLAAASNVRLGELLHVEYGEALPDFYSPTRVNADANAMCMRAAVPDIAPQDIIAHENVRCTWSIL